MSLVIRRLMLCAGLFTFLVSLPLALGVPPALAGEPCPHEHGAEPFGMPHQHQHPQHHDPACLCCCAGACIGIPDLARAPAVTALCATATVFYADAGMSLAGRSLRPDPAPPRSIA